MAKSQSASDLIAAAKARSAPAKLSAKALRELRAVVEHNDVVGARNSLRVNGDKTVAMLQTHGWPGRTHKALDKLCRESLGRKSFGTP
jgi:hypothetical protein